MSSHAAPSTYGVAGSASERIGAGHTVVADLSAARGLVDADANDDAVRGASPHPEPR
jgi:hypothetical protein